MTSALFPPFVLRDYALLADGERGAVVGPDGAIVWLCFPRWDSPAVLSALVDGAGGGFAVTPVDRHVWGGCYEPRSLVWRSRWVTDTAVIECSEALALPARPDQLVLLRRIHALHGDADVDVRLRARGDYGRAPAPRLRQHEDGTWQGRLPEGRLALRGLPDATVEDGVLTARLRVPAGQTHDLVLVLSTQEAEADLPDADQAWTQTRAQWRRRCPQVDAGTASRDAEHAYAVLAGLTSSAGGMVAAATLGLPERAREGRNYDYRYAWIRDQCYAGHAASYGNDLALLGSASTFVGQCLLEHGPQLAPAYRVDGSRVPQQHELDLPGYPGGSARVGNWVDDQFQLDAFGEALVLLARADVREVLDVEGWRAAHVAADAVAARWTEPDAGIWEVEPAAWAHSRLICAAGLRAVAGRPAAGTSAAGWLALADQLVAETSRTSLHPSGRWQRTPDDPRVDAALLLPGLHGAVAPDDPRTAATLAAVLADLTEDGYGFRFRHRDLPLGDAEGSFLLVGFLISQALRQQGEREQAARWFERTRAACGPAGLLTEEFDVRQRQLRGNLPQAFIHALLLGTVLQQD